MSKPHKHAALIHAWADGAEIECRPANTGCGWVLISGAPCWEYTWEYRIKPVTKLDVAIEALERFANTQRFSHIVSGEAEEALNKIRSME